MQEQITPMALIRQLKRDLKIMANALQKALTKIDEQKATIAKMKEQFKEELKAERAKTRAAERQLAKFKKELMPATIQLISDEEANKEII